MQPRKGKPKKRINNLLTSHEAYLMYLQHMKRLNRSDATIESHLYSLCVFNDWLLENGILNPLQVTYDNIEQYQIWLSRSRTYRGVKAKGKASQGNNLSGIRQFYRFLYEDKQIIANPAHEIKLPKKEKRLHRDILTTEELSNLLNNPDTNTATGLRDAVVLRLLSLSALRVSELYNLNIQNIDIDNREIRIINGKGGKDRITFVDYSSLAVIRKYLLHGRGYLVRGRNNAFVINDVGKRITKGEARSIVKFHAAKTKIRKNITCHSLRRTFGTLMLTKGGINLKALAEIMGHEKIETTAGYTKVDIRDLSSIYNQSHPRSYL